MGRLIDADVLIEMIEGSEELLDFQKDELIVCVYTCDTAYDVDKVLEELEEIHFEDSCGYAVLIHDAEPIIRNGGKE